MISAQTLQLILTSLSDQKVRLVKGKSWGHSIYKKKVSYFEDSLEKLDQIHSIGLLMRELGFINHSQSIVHLELLGEYTPSTTYAFEIFESIRIEEKMRSSYQCADSYIPKGRLSESHSELISYLTVTFNEQLKEDVKIPDLVTYGFLVALESAGMTQERAKMQYICNEKVSDAFENTKSYIEKIPKLKTVYEVAKMYNEIYPYIKDLLEDFDKQHSFIELIQNSYKSLGASRHEDEKKVDSDITYKDLKSEVKGTSSLLRRTLLSVLRENDLQKYSSQKRSGKVNRRIIHKTERMFDKIFKRKLDKKNLNYEWGVLIDYSCSMMPDKFIQALYGMALVIESIKNINTIKFSLAGFSNSVEIVKYMNSEFSEKAVDKFIKIAHDRSGGTNDRDALKEMIKLYSLDQGVNRFMIILTDGEGSGDIKAILEEYKKRGVMVYLIGVDISEKHIDKNYKNKILVQNIREIPKVFGSILKKHIKMV